MAQPQAQQKIPSKKELEKKKNEELVLKVVQTFANLTVSPLLIMWIWNWIIPGLFGLPTLTYFTALGLYVLCKILFGNQGGLND